jgi:hypothetical protein
MKLLSFPILVLSKYALKSSVKIPLIINNKIKLDIYDITLEPHIYCEICHWSK